MLRKQGELFSYLLNALWCSAIPFSTRCKPEARIWLARLYHSHWVGPHTPLQSWRTLWVDLQKGAPCVDMDKDVHTRVELDFPTTMPHSQLPPLLSFYQPTGGLSVLRGTSMLESWMVDWEEWRCAMYITALNPFCHCCSHWEGHRCCCTLCIAPTPSISCSSRSLLVPRH